MSFASELMAMIDSGAGLVVATVSDDGEPRADRAWAAAVVDENRRRVRFVMSADDPAVVRNLEAGSVSLTGAEVVTYQSIQLKGRPVVVEPPTDDDVEMARVSICPMVVSSSPTGSCASTRPSTCPDSRTTWRADSSS